MSGSSKAYLSLKVIFVGTPILKKITIVSLSTRLAAIRDWSPHAMGCTRDWSPHAIKLRGGRDNAVLRIHLVTESGPCGRQVLPASLRAQGPGLAGKTCRPRPVLRAGPRIYF